MTLASDIRGVLIQIQGARLLLPNAAIAEVLSYADPDPVDGAPDWLLGRLRWRGWQVPLVSFARLSGIAGDERGGLGSKILVLKALGGDARLPHFALLTQGFPRLVTVSRDTLLRSTPGDRADGEQQDDAGDPAGVRMQVTLKDDAAHIPDLAVIEEALHGALAHAA
ncbi:MAG TPA: chemotaxis protein CheW [Luteimonas sp.]|nr:chemotaxis protein CheW [Luteimonas sp.]